MKLEPGIWVFRSLLFWEQIAEIYDTYGLPRDIISLKLRENGVEFTDPEFDRLFEYMVARRNGRGQVEDVSQFLIPIPWHANDIIEQIVY